MLGQRFDRSFTRVVGGVSEWVGNALLAARDDDGGGRGAAAGLEGRDVGVQAVDDTEEVS